MSSAPPHTDRESYRRMAAEAGVAFVSLDPSEAGHPEYREVNPLAAGLLSESTCRQFAVLPIGYRDGVVLLAASNPYDPIPLDLARRLTGRRARSATRVWRRWESRASSPPTAHGTRASTTSRSTPAPRRCCAWPASASR